MLELLYQDEHLAIVNKPAGWLVHRTPLDKGESRFVLQALRDQIGRPVWPVHRLDKGTSGVLVFALSAEVARALGEAFESGEGLHKVYRAMVRGWPADALFIDHPLRRMPDDMRSQREEVQSAQTRLLTLRRGVLPVPQGAHPQLRWAEVQLQPLTGRRHQLRRHAKHIAHPILGDATHGKGPLNRAVAAHLGVQRLWLHAQSLQLRHPHSGQRLDVHAPPEPAWGLWDAHVLANDGGLDAGGKLRR